MLNGKIVVWCLFDDGEMSYYNSLKDDKRFEVHSFGINKHPSIINYHQVDLSIQNPNLISDMQIYPKPDVIIASPPCESWSIADNQRRNIKSIKQGEECLEVQLRTKYFYSINNARMFIEKKTNLMRDFFKQNQTRLNGESTVLGLYRIITHFNPTLYIIENPQTSLIWQYINHYINDSDKYVNLAYYNNWGYPIKKPTIFYANYDMKIPRENIKATLIFDKWNGYDKRSSIPQPLIKSIFDDLFCRFWNNN